MPKEVNESELSNSRRKSSRVKKTVNNSLLNDLPEDVMNSMLGVDGEDKMPPGFNPSDDSEDDYKPETDKRGKKRGETSDFDSEEEVRPKKSRPGRKPKYAVTQSRAQDVSPVVASSPAVGKPRIKTEPSSQEGDSIVCIFCNKTFNVHTDARFHYSVHYYESNSFLSILKPQDLKDGKAQDDIGKVYKYTCPHDGCTKRKMGYKEMCVHLATAHQQLKQLMMADSRPGIKEIANRLYPLEPFPLVKVKQEKNISTVPAVHSIRQNIALDNDNSEDVDDPAEPSLAVKLAVKAPVKIIPKKEVKTEGGSYSLAPRCDKVHHCLICNGPGKSNKDGRNLNLGSGLQELKYHYSVCVYNAGGLYNLIDPGQGGVDPEDLEIFGAKYRYKCPFPDCDKNKGRSKPIGYKEYAIHCGVAHHQVERWMVVDTRPGMQEIYDIIKRARELEDGKLEDMPDVIVEEMHTCLICKGEEKDGRNLSFGFDKIYSTRYHYAACYYSEGVYLTMYPPGAQNCSEDGKPIDYLGKEVKYFCQEKGCKVKRKMGYREFSIHMANEHGGLEKVMKADHREEVRDIVGRMKKK